MNPPKVSLLQQSAWWLVPYLVLMLVMLHAMMEFTVSLLVQRSPGQRRPVPSKELRRRLLALNKANQAHPLVEGQDCDLEIKWAYEDIRRSRFAISRQASSTHLRFLLDESRHELRMHQIDSGSSFFVGLEGWLPRLQGAAGFGAGPPGAFLTKDISQVAQRGGWTVRPVLWWFQATYAGTRFLRAITPAPLRTWPARRFWGLLYPGSFLGGIGYLVVIIGGLDWRNGLILAGVTAGWWGMWGFLVWMLRGFPAFWRAGGAR